MNVAASASYEAVADLGISGLTGTCGVRVIDNIGTTPTPRATAGIIEHPAGSGLYQKVMTAPSIPGQYTIVWDMGTTAPGTVAIEELVVT